MYKPELKKKNVTIKLYPEQIARIEKAMANGFKKNTIIEKGMELYLDKIEKEQQIINKAAI
jgi:hypothetical protein